MNLYLAQISWLPSIVSKHRTEWLSVPCWTSRDRLSHVCSTNRATSSSGSNTQTFNRPKMHHCLSLPASLKMSFVFTYWGVSSIPISNVKICLGFHWSPSMWNGTNFGGVQEKLSASVIPRLDPKPPCVCKKTAVCSRKSWGWCEKRKAHCGAGTESQWSVTLSSLRHDCWDKGRSKPKFSTKAGKDC